MQSGLINKVAVTPENLSETKELKHICGYYTKPRRQATAKRSVHLAAIMMNHMLAKNYDKDVGLAI